MFDVISVFNVYLIFLYLQARPSHNLPSGEEMGNIIVNNSDNSSITFISFNGGEWYNIASAVFSVGTIIYGVVTLVIYWQAKHAYYAKVKKDREEIN